MTTTHKHWMAKDGFWANLTHPISLTHTDIMSLMRHHFETGEYQRWVESNGLRLVDSTRYRYESEVLKKMEVD